MLVLYYCLLARRTEAHVRCERVRSNGLFSCHFLVPTLGRNEERGDEMNTVKVYSKIVKSIPLGSSLDPFMAGSVASKL